LSFSAIALVGGVSVGVRGVAAAEEAGFIESPSAEQEPFRENE
jgi:hypothetical protein